MSNMERVGAFNLDQFTDPSTSNVVVVSGPSAVGKETVIASALSSSGLDIIFPLSFTTRDPRPGKTSYTFVRNEGFMWAYSDGQFFEINTYNKNQYGSPHPEPILQNLQEEGRPAAVMYELEVGGAQELKRVYPEALWIGLLPPSDEELERRLRKRGTESEDSIRRRLETWRNSESRILNGGEGCGPDLTIVNNNLEVATTAFIHAIKYGTLPEAG